MLQYLTFSRSEKGGSIQHLIAELKESHVFFSFNCSGLPGLLVFNDNEEPETMIENEVRELFKLITSLR